MTTITAKYLRKPSDIETVALANADYEDRKQSGERVNYRIIERFWKLRAGQLHNYRSNRFRRKDRGVMKMFTSNAKPINPL